MIRAGAPAKKEKRRAGKVTDPLIAAVVGKRLFVLHPGGRRCFYHDPKRIAHLLRKYYAGETIRFRALKFTITVDMRTAKRLAQEKVWRRAWALKARANRLERLGETLIFPPLKRGRP